jgi:hypothetical protein
VRYMVVLEQRSGDAAGPADLRRRAPLGLRGGLVALGLIVAIIAGGLWWLHGGTRLQGSGGYSGVVRADEQLSVGIQLVTTSGSSVVLDSVSASNPNGAQVTWSIYRNDAGHDGFGSVLGPLGPEWPTSAVHGYRVSRPFGHPERGATWLVASVRASRPGVYRVSNIKIKYRSGVRVRRSDTHAFVCVLVAPPGQEARLRAQMHSFTGLNSSSVDDLVTELEKCANQSLG